MKPWLKTLTAAIVLATITPAQAAPHAGKKAKPAAAKKAEPEARAGLELAHTFTGEAEVELKKLVDRFNEANAASPIKLVRQEANHPVLLNILKRTQVADFVAAKHGFKALHAVMSDAGEKFDATSLSRDLKAGVTDDKGRFVALPIAYATPVLYYNKTAFRKAKLDPDQPPATWLDVQDVAAKLKAAGVACPYTTSWPTWIHVDNLTALSGGNLSTPKGELNFNGFVQVKHLAKLATWKQAGLFHVFGRKNEADEQFRSGKCAMLTSDSWAHTDFRDAQGVELGVAPLPNQEDIFGGRRHTLADGPSLWVGAGYKPTDYKVAARFIGFLLSPEVQVQLASIYGHLPLTEAGRLAIKSAALRDRTQTLEIAYAELKGEGGNYPLRVSAIDPVRIILDEEIEKVWADQTPPKAALDTAVARGNAILKAKPALKKQSPL